MGGKGGLRGLGVRAARAIEGRLGGLRGLGRVDVYISVMGRLSFA